LSRARRAQRVLAALTDAADVGEWVASPMEGFEGEDLLLEKAARRGNPLMGCPVEYPVEKREPCVFLRRLFRNGPAPYFLRGDHGARLLFNEP